LKLLAISTSTPRGSAALFDIGRGSASATPFDVGRGSASATPFDVALSGARLLAVAAYADLQGHAERIFGVLDEVLGASGVPRAALDAIACDIGPGSFTGVRVAVAAAKGIAFALGIPVVGVTSLEAMAAAAFADDAASPGDLLVPLIDAKKGEVFLAAFHAPAAASLLPPRHVPREAVFDAIGALASGRRMVAVGEVAGEIALLGPLSMRGDTLDLPHAIWIGRLAAMRLGSADPHQRGVHREHTAREHDAALLEPLYVRAPDAKPSELGYTPPR
jgi:tRNA threonylcarbamoyl adenosine modification protein YeaZ